MFTLKAGANTIAVWFGDLCERDTRFVFELSVVEGRGLSVALDCDVPPMRRRRSQRCWTAALRAAVVSRGRCRADFPEARV